MALLCSVELGAAGGIGQHRMLDHVLSDRLDQRVVADRLHEDRAVVVARRRRHVHLQRQAAVLLQHPVVDVLDALEPRHARVVDVVGLVVEDGEFLDLAHDLAEVGFAVGGLADWLRAERRQEIVAQVVILQRRLRHVAEIDAVNVGQEDDCRWRGRCARRPGCAGRSGNRRASCGPSWPLSGSTGSLKKMLQPVEVGAQAVQHDDVGRDQQEIARERRVRLVELVEVAPGDQQRQHLGLAGAGRHLDDEARPVLVEHAAGHRAGGIEAQQVELVAGPPDVIEPDDRLDRFALGEVVAERHSGAVRVLGQVFGLEPPAQQRLGRWGCPRVAVVAPVEHFLADLGDERRQELFIGRAAQLFGGWEPAHAGGSTS